MDSSLSRALPVRKPDSMQERIRAVLEEEILSGIRPPGSAIDEKALAASLQASRTPVREALLLLAAQGLVDIVPRSGTYVRRASAGELVASLEALCEIESVLARLAARRASGDQHQALQLALKNASQSAAASDKQAYQEANAALHEIIYQASGNPVLVQHARSVRKALAAYRQRSFDEPGRLAASDREHHSIVEAICNRDEAAADAAMRRHINVGGEAMAALVRAAEASLAQAPRPASRTPGQARRGSTGA